MLPIQSDAIHLEKRTKIRLGHALMIPWPWVYKRIQFTVIIQRKIIPEKCYLLRYCCVAALFSLPLPSLDKKTIS
jgi:hypothetical protein